MGFYLLFISPKFSVPLILDDCWDTSTGCGVRMSLSEQHINVLCLVLSNQYFCAHQYLRGRENNKGSFSCNFKNNQRNPNLLESCTTYNFSSSLCMQLRCLMPDFFVLFVYCIFRPFRSLRLLCVL